MEQISQFTFSQIVIALGIFVAGFVVGRLARKFIAFAGHDKLDRHLLVILQRAAYYLIIVLFAITALQHLGVELSVLLGAAGILTVAVGFASQTSASNVISGLFLLGEKPFGVGDIITVSGTTGEVLSIDLLSIKLRTMDNLFVRIPNETIIKSEVTTLSKFPIRRFDLRVGVAYKEDLDKVKKVLLSVAEEFPMCLEDPAPVYILQGFGDSSVDIQFSTWGRRDHFLAFKNGMIERVKKAFDEHQIEIPFPQRSIHVVSEQAPISEPK